MVKIIICLIGFWDKIYCNVLKIFQCANECSEMASKTIVADLVKGEKLDGKNYDMWSKKP